MLRIIGRCSLPFYICKLNYFSCYTQNIIIRNFSKKSQSKLNQEKSNKMKENVRNEFNHLDDYESIVTDYKLLGDVILIRSKYKILMKQLRI